MKRFKMVGAAGALVAAALVGGTLFSSVLAAPTANDTTTVLAANGFGSDYMDTYLDALASELGVDRAALGPAAVSAANAAIDAAEAAGDITADRATELRDQLAAIDDPETLLYGRGVFGGGPGHGPGNGPGGPGGPGMGGALHGGLDAAATALDMDASDLVGQLRDGSSLMDVAAAQEVDYSTVVSAITDAVSTDLTTDVSDGRITQDRADQVSSDLQTWLDAGGQADAIPFGIGHDGGMGPRGGPGGFGF